MKLTFGVLIGAWRRKELNSRRAFSDTFEDKDTSLFEAWAAGVTADTHKTMNETTTLSKTFLAL